MRSSHHLTSCTFIMAYHFAACTDDRAGGANLDRGSLETPDANSGGNALGSRQQSQANRSNSNFRHCLLRMLEAPAFFGRPPNGAVDL
jgi:hypothetical protein